jgi:hypothetical protein
MKWLLTTGISLFCFGLGICSEKLYVTPDQVEIGTHQILINIQGQLHPVNGLFQDAQGLHVMANEIVNEHTFSWTCPRGHFSPRGTGMCNEPGCPFGKK